MAKCMLVDVEDCGDPSLRKNFSTFEQIVKNFNEVLVPVLNKDKDHYQKPSGSGHTAERIKKAAASENYMKKVDPHQRRIGRQKLEKIGDILALDSKRLEDCAKKGFDALYTEVEKILSSHKGYGRLFCYDFCKRFGLAYNAIPQKVYLHAGTSEGVKRLLKRNLLSISGKLENTLPLAVFPAPLCSLPADDLEGILCIYKDSFDSIRA